MGAFTWLAVHLAVAYLHLLLAWRLYPQRKEHFMIFVFWVFTVLSMLLHTVYATEKIVQLLLGKDQIKPVVLMGYWLLAFLPAPLVTLFLGELKPNTAKQSAVVKIFANISENPKRLFLTCLLISSMTVALSIRSMQVDPEQVISFGNLYSLYYMFVFAVIWMIMLIVGFRPDSQQGRVLAPIFRWFMVLLIVLYVMAHTIGGGKVWLLIPIISTVGLSLCFCWYRFRVQFMDVVINQFIRILMAIMATLGFIKMIELASDVDVDIQKFIIFSYVIILAFSYRWLSNKLASLWHPSIEKLLLIHSELPALLASRYNRQEAISATEVYLSQLFNSDVAINRKLNNPVQTLVMKEGSSVTIELGYLRRWMPWFSEALHWVQVAGVYLQSHIKLLDSLEKEHLQQLKAKELTSLAAKAELNAMRSQIRPHFLFNVLNSIHSFVSVDPKRAEHTIEILSDVMRSVLLMSDKDEVPLDDELSITEKYLLIEKVRYGDQFDYKINVELGSKTFLIPPFSIQPLVENVIKHAVDAQFEPVLIQIEVKGKGNRLCVHVLDDGPGLENKNMPAGLGIALKNIESRLINLYGKSSQLTLKNRADKGAEVMILIPIKLNRN